LHGGRGHHARDPEPESKKIIVSRSSKNNHLTMILQKDSWHSWPKCL
jgi:hypothetical protein